MKGLDVRIATVEDLPGILETMRLSLGESPLLRRTPELWNWKHKENPFGESIVLVAVSGEGVVAGVRAFMRWQLQVEDDNILQCLRPVDTATHPDFLRRGIFRSLTLSAVDAARQEGADLIFNTPNEKSAPGYLEMGWSHVTWVGVQVRPRLGKCVTLDADTPPRVEDLIPQALDPGVVSQSKETAPLRGMRTPRHSAYLQWRFTKHPYASYGWVPGPSDNGLVVRASRRNERSELVVSDMLGSPDPGLIRSAARSSRARYMAGWFSPGSQKRAASQRGGLVPIPGVKTLRLVAQKLTPFPTNPFDVGSWDLSTSDLELL